VENLYAPPGKDGGRSKGEVILSEVEEGEAIAEPRCLPVLEELGDGGGGGRGGRGGGWRRRRRRRASVLPKGRSVVRVGCSATGRVGCEVLAPCLDAAEEESLLSWLDVAEAAATSVDLTEGVSHRRVEELAREEPEAGAPVEVDDLKLLHQGKRAGEGEVGVVLQLQEAEVGRDGADKRGGQELKPIASKRE